MKQPCNACDTVDYRSPLTEAGTCFDCTCHCSARLDNERTNGNPKGGVRKDATDFFWYSDRSFRHYNKHAHSWLWNHAPTCGWMLHLRSTGVVP